MMNQMKIRYDKESYLVSHYLAEFFKMCGFLVCEEYQIETEVDEEIESAKEIIIEAKKMELGKKLLIETVAAYLSDMVDIEQFRPLMDAYVDFSIYSACFWLENYGKDDKRKSTLKFLNCFEDATEFLTAFNKNNSFVKFAILYCKYKQDIYCKFCCLRYKFKIDELCNEISIFCNNSPESFYFSALALLAFVYDLEPIYVKFCVKYYAWILEGCSISNKPFIWYKLAKAYENYDANIDDTIACYRKSLQLQPNDVFVLYDFVSCLRNKKILPETKNPFADSVELSKLVEEAMQYLNRILELLTQKEKSIPLSPKELKLRVFSILSLMQCYFCEPQKNYWSVLNIGERYFEKYYQAAISPSVFFDFFDSKETQITVTEISLAKAIKKGYSTLYYASQYLGLENKASFYMHKLSSLS